MPPAVFRLSGQPSAGELAMLERLVVESHWNQTTDDWQVFVNLGEVHVIRDADGMIVASGAVLPMGRSVSAGQGTQQAADISWISMILVTPARRGGGYGRAVFDACLRSIQSAGRIPMLDATPAGEALYQRFGFQPLWRLTRWRRPARDGDGARGGDRDDRREDAPTRADGPHRPDDAHPDSLPPLLAADRLASGFERNALLTALAGRSSSRALAHGEACALLRAGRTASQIGPLLAADEQAAAALLADLVANETTALLIDVPDGRPLIQEALQADGFQEERRFARMVLRGPDQMPPDDRPELIHAIAGPEFA